MDTSSRLARTRYPGIYSTVTKSGVTRFKLAVKVRDVDGRRRQRWFTAATLAEARAMKADIETKVRTGTHIDRDTTTLNDYLDGWLAGKARELKPSTLHSYTGCLKPIRETYGGRPLQRITSGDLNKLVTAMLKSGGRNGKGRSARTIRLAFTILSAAMKDAASEGIIAHNPVTKVRMPRQTKREMKCWTSDQANTFLEQVEGDRLVGCWQLTMRGLRRSEVLGLRWSDIDFDAGTLTIRTTRLQVGREVVESTPKSARGRRVLPMDKPLMRALKAQLKRQSVQQIDGHVAVDELGQPLRPEAYGDTFAAHTTAAGLPMIRLHDARHTAITVMLSRGVPVHVVAAYAGHDPSMTLTVYAHALPDHLKQAGDALGQAYGG